MPEPTAHDASELNRSSVSLLNTLPKALRHYENEVRATLGVEAARVTSVRTPSAEMGSAGKVTKLARAAQHASFMGRQREPFISLWPALGHLEFAVASRRAAGAVVIHDPDPIRQSIGYGARSMQAGVAASRRAGHFAIAHSRAAEARLREIGYGKVLYVPHPMLEPTPRLVNPAGDRVVRVLGQYKPTRDLDLLEKLGARLTEQGVRGEIVGRGWPQIQNWTVRAEFVSEEELDLLVATAGAVLVPYTKYWQSGLAIRAAEHSVPVVGAAGGFLDELLGTHNSGLVADVDDLDEWTTALVTVLSDAATTTSSDSAVSYFRQARTGWTDLLTRLGASSTESRNESE
ncbi:MULTISPECIES: glycosyltransferase [unclassified Pseudoclavibacter]|uniref:glycosyltransferase n=1 Tax=unclassified Pseudoclavibacter TaxID=2615177 RepID=UPI001BA53364|nr:glycosyltransferase [Pseudoclavibacter sp. Marseille-Q4354]MBS3180073.1 glycosyltransferase [Pseudoclavibacter sp. Marseille-Q4354]